MNENPKDSWFRIICDGFGLFGDIMIEAAKIIAVILIVYSWVYGLKTQWGEINIDLFPKPYIYMK